VRRVLPVADYRALLVLVVAGTVVAAARDYRTFRSIVVNTGMQDLAVRMIRGAMQR